jgi:sn1-specific diacylglycerol lipase
MPMHGLYPPGRVLWAVRDSDVSYAAPPPAERRYSPMESLRAQRERDSIRLFEVLDVEKVFTQIIFSRDMIRCGSLPILQFCAQQDADQLGLR